MKPITVLLADDHTIVREGFRKLFELEPDFQVVGEASDGRQAVALGLSLCPDVILMDIAMPELNGLEAARQLTKSLPSTKVLILSAYSDDAYVQKALECGSVGFLLKRTSAREVCQAIRKVHRGGMYFSASLNQRMNRSGAKSLNRKGKTKLGANDLTPRELEILQLTAEGRANKEMSEALGISIKTVEKHRASLMQKLDIHNTAGLTRYAISVRLIESSVLVTINEEGMPPASCFRPPPASIAAISLKIA